MEMCSGALSSITKDIKESISIKMEPPIRELGKMISNMEKVSLDFKMDKSIKGSSSRGRKKAEVSTNSKTAIFTVVLSSKTKDKV